MFGMFLGINKILDVVLDYLKWLVCYEIVIVVLIVSNDDFWYVLGVDIFGCDLYVFSVLVYFCYCLYCFVYGFYVMLF